MHRFRPLLLVLALVLAACTADGADNSTTTPSTGAETTTTTAATTTEATEAPSEPVPGTEELPEEVQAQIQELIGVTEEIRELEFLEPPTIAVVSREELAARVRDSLDEDLEDLPADERLLKLLGLVEEDVDLLSLYTDLYGEQVAGFYDGDTRELVVPVTDEGFSPLQKATLVHELTHALTDQHFGIWDRYTELTDNELFDQSIAYLSVIEGDATLTEVLYISSLPVPDQQAVIQESFEADRTVFESVPLFLQSSLIFPYQEGFAFVQTLYDQGQFQAINDAYLEPPVSSEQIITPGDFGEDEPLDVAPLDAEIEGSELVYEAVWGELGFALMLDQVLGPGAADLAADGWGGDVYRQFFDGEDAALILRFVGDTDADAAELEEALVAYVVTALDVGEPEDVDGALLFEGDPFAYVSRSGNTVTFVVADDAADGNALVEAA